MDATYAGATGSESGGYGESDEWKRQARHEWDVRDAMAVSEDDAAGGESSAGEDTEGQDPDSPQAARTGDPAYLFPTAAALMLSAAFVWRRMRSGNRMER